MSVKIGNMILEKNKLNHNNKVITLNHLNEFDSFIYYTKARTADAIAKLIEPMNIRLIQFNNELQIIKTTDKENEYSSTQHYLMLHEYRLEENRKNLHSDLNFIIGYNLLIYILSKKEENKHLNLDGFEIAEYIISNAWYSGFVTQIQFNEYYMSIYNHENRMDLFADNKKYNTTQRPPHTLAKPVTFNFGNYDSIFSPDYIFENPHSDIMVLDGYITFYKYNHTLKIKNNFASLLKDIPEGTSLFKYNINNTVNRYRVEKTKLKPKKITDIFSEHYIIVLRFQQPAPKIEFI